MTTGWLGASRVACFSEAYRLSYKENIRRMQVPRRQEQTSRPEDCEGQKVKRGLVAEERVRLHSVITSVNTGDSGHLVPPTLQVL